MKADPAILAQAMDWHLRMLGETDPAGWDALSAWLEASPEHLAAYEQVAELDADLEAPLRDLVVADLAQDGASSPSANDNERGWRQRLPFAGWAAAAMGIAAGALFMIHSPLDPALTIETPAGQQRTTTLADGSEIHVNGESRLVLGGSGHRTVQLLAGEASFSVHHDAARPFAVMVGDHELRDVGTRFNVRRDGQDFVIEVAEGRVDLDPSGESVAINAGEALALRGGVLQRSKVSAAQVGSWQQRRLSYDAAPIGQIAEDLTRMLGVSITVAPEVVSQRYTGMIIVPADRAEALRVVSLTLDLKVRANGAGYVLMR